MPHSTLSRRDFLAGTTALGLGTLLPGCSTLPSAADLEAVIDIHQHLNYSGRPDNVFLAHQHAMGFSRTILLPAGRPVTSPATHNGAANGLEAKCSGNEACLRFAKSDPRHFLFGANEVSDLPDARAEIERYLKLGAVIIAEQKFGLECDSADMQRLYQLSAAHRVPVLMHWQYQRYNYGFERFHRMLEKYPRTIFIGHAQTWWANIDKNHKDQSVLYPKGKVTPGGLTDRYLADYANLFGDLSAGSGLNALTRDEDQARAFLQRHQDKLIYGSDCSDWMGAGAACQGAQTLATLRRLAPSKAVERKLLFHNAKRVFRL
jgi:predicted TIM-barrel fold metal-dependent hydrolase